MKKTTTALGIYRTSPVEALRKEMPRGDGNWEGFDSCYTRLQQAAIYLANNPSTYLGQDHVTIMAAMASGHEETMKYYVHLAYTYRWIQ